jgi:hypothetical protein
MSFIEGAFDATGANPFGSSGAAAVDPPPMLYPELNDVCCLPSDPVLACQLALVEFT